MRWISSFFLFLPLFALPLFAQDDALVGTWETSFTGREVGDGTIRLSFGRTDVSNSIRSFRHRMTTWQRPETRISP